MIIETWSVVYCDGCGDPAVDKGSTPEEALKVARRDGWHRDIESNQWVDFCPACWAKREKGEK